MTRRSIVLPTNSDISFDRTSSAAAPVAPTLLTATPGNGQVTLTWSSSTGASEYKVYFDTSSGVTTSDNVLNVGNTTSIVHTGLTNGTTYYYKVVAVGVAGDSDLSNELSAKPNVALFDDAESTLFNGVNQWVNYGNNHNYENSVQMSFSAWIYINNYSQQRCIWSKVDGSVDGWGFYINTSGKLFLQMRSGGQNRSLTSSGSITAMNWHHVCFTYDGGQNISGLTFYIDGSADAASSSGTISNSLIVSDDSIVGARNGTFLWSGYINDLAFWDKELSASEVSEIYNSGLPDNLLDHSASSNLDNYYLMGDGDTEPTITDQVGSVDGTIIGGATFESEVPT